MNELCARDRNIDNNSPLSSSGHQVKAEIRMFRCVPISTCTRISGSTRIIGNVVRRLDHHLCVLSEALSLPFLIFDSDVQIGPGFTIKTRKRSGRTNEYSVTSEVLPDVAQKTRQERFSNVLQHLPCRDNVKRFFDSGLTYEIRLCGITRE